MTWTWWRKILNNKQQYDIFNRKQGDNNNEHGKDSTDSNSTNSEVSSNGYARTKGGNGGIALKAVSGGGSGGYFTNLDPITVSIPNIGPITSNITYPTSWYGQFNSNWNHSAHVVTEKQSEECLNTTQLDPVKAWKYSRIVQDQISGLIFAGVHHTSNSFSNEELAVCRKASGLNNSITYNINTGFSSIIDGPQKTVCNIPDTNCTCGFYAVENIDKLDNNNRTAFILEVDLYGKILLGEKAYRAEYQRVLCVHVQKNCVFVGEKLNM